MRLLTSADVIFVTISTFIATAFLRQPVFETAVVGAAALLIIVAIRVIINQKAP